MTHTHKIKNGVRIELTQEEITTFNNQDNEANNKAFDKALNILRLHRNNLLKETDHLALSDNTLSTDMATYRTNLRNLTNGLNTVEDVNSVTWPTKPGA